MKLTTATILASAATAALAAPSKLAARTPRYILPNAMAVHNVNNNVNTISTQIQTIRQGKVETSTLVSFDVPMTAEGSTCKTGIFAGLLSGGDNVRGEQAVDIFSTQLTNITNTPTGDQRNNELGRLRFNAGTNKFDFDKRDVRPSIQTFPCPAGETLQWEIVAVGDNDLVIIGQDFTYSGSGLYNGIFIEYI